MFIKKLLNLFFSSTILLCNAALSADKNLQENWIERCPNDYFCFTHPVEMTPNKTQAIDSSSGELQDSSMTLVYDLGWYASQFSELTTATHELVIIDGREGKILIQDNKMALSIAKIEGRKRFSMLLTFQGEASIDQGKRIFSSLRFNIH